MTSDRKDRIENLNLNKETITDLAEEQAEQAQGGGKCPYTVPPSNNCEAMPV